MKNTGSGLIASLFRPSWALILSCALFGCGSDSSNTSTSGTDFPGSLALADFQTFIGDLKYQEPGWQAETSTPRERSSSVSPHGRVVVWLNSILLTSQRAGNGAVDGTAHDTNSMVVKELYDDSDMKIGVAAMLKKSGGKQEWAFFCDGPPNRCGLTEPTMPFYSDEGYSACAFCHGGFVYTVPEGLVPDA